MPISQGLGLNPPPHPAPICEMRDRFGEAVDTDRFEFVVTTPWLLWAAMLTQAVQNGTGGGGSTFPATPYATLTPAASITPTLELISWDGSFSILLDRATTTINAATLNGLTPPDGWKFQIIFTNDGTDARDVAFNAAYLNCAPVSGVANAREIYHFTVQGGEFLCDYQAQSIL